MSRGGRRRAAARTAAATAALAAAASPVACSAAPAGPRGAADLVEVHSVDPTIVVELRYATPDNFLGRAVYPAGARCLLRRPVALRLARVQRALRERGLGLKVWDAYRPLAAQRAMWELVPDERFVAPPSRGSRHNRGAAVDVTLVDAAGRELAMPTGFDEFGERASRTAPAPDEAASHRAELERAMVREGFLPLPEEWWHYDEPGWEAHPILDALIDGASPAGDAVATARRKVLPFGCPSIGPR